MSPQKNLSSFIDNILLSYTDNEIQDFTQSIIDEYKKLNEKCDSIILKIKQRKIKN